MPKVSISYAESMPQKASAKQAVRWSIRVSPDTDASLRQLLGESQMASGGLSRFIGETVRARVFQLKVQNIQARNADMDPGELQSLIDGAVREVRKSGRSGNE